MGFYSWSNFFIRCCFIQQRILILKTHFQPTQCDTPVSPKKKHPTLYLPLVISIPTFSPAEKSSNVDLKLLPSDLSFTYWIAWGNYSSYNIKSYYIFNLNSSYDVRSLMY